MKPHIFSLSEIPDEAVKYAVIIAFSNDEYVFVKQKGKSSLEYPGGHREKEERIESCARRELVEETGAISFTLKAIGAYQMLNKPCIEYTAIYFANIESFSGNLDFEIETVNCFQKMPTHKKWTYPLIQPLLIKLGENELFNQKMAEPSQLARFKKQLAPQVCYTELVYQRVNKKLQTNYSQQEIESLVNKTIQAKATKIERRGKNYYLQAPEDHLQLTINAGNYRLITADLI